MIKKLLVANRGEIACRIIRTCRDLGIKTVAVYSEADKNAPHVKIADECYLLGAPRAKESYLNINKILSIAKVAQVDAIHPGYGFLSENPQFVQACEENGLIFIGPNSAAVKNMGYKIAARQTMEKAGLPIIPGTNKAVSSIEDALTIAQKIGYPVMLKASAGGGGIGMQLVYSDEELRKAFINNAKSAKAHFGNGDMFIEKKIEDARHIEIQILADHHGNIIHLYDRDCSIQRRNQKVIEEAPSPFISNATREKMGKSAVLAGKAIDYTNAGTIEFLVDKYENYYFLEMNTRIQVEQPVTEEVTGIDIVKEQINIAEDNALSFKQEDIDLNGCAIEARIYAEDPEKFLPSPGYITTFELPHGENIRNDVGVSSHFNMIPFYDPMLSKLIVTGDNREKAIYELNRALEDFNVEGIKTNIPMLKKVINHQQFIEGNVTTSFVEKYYLPMITKI